MRYCPLCLCADIATYGAGYWHTEHHLPDVTCCASHGISLLEIAHDGSERQDRQRLILPPQSSPTSPIAAEAPTVQEHRLATLSRDLLYAHCRPVDPARRVEAYRLGMARVGVPDSRGGFEYRRLSCALQDFHHDFVGLPHASRLLATEKTPLAWLHTIFEKPEKSVHPVCHLLLIEFLFGSVNAYLSTLASTSGSSARQLAPKDDGGGQHIEATARTNRYLLDTSMSCRQAAILSGTSVTAIVSRRRAAGIPVSDRRKRLNQEIIEALRSDIVSGVSMPEIADKHKVSLSTVYRVLRETPDLSAQRNATRAHTEQHLRRTQWLEAVDIASASDRAGSPRSFAMAAYSWLYRHDRAWLCTVNLAVRKRSSHARVDWRDRDLKLCLRLQEQIQLLRDNGCRRRIGRTLMQQLVGEAMFRANRTRLPTLSACIEQNVESRVAFGVRRVDAAIAQLREEGTPLAVWRVRRRAGIRIWSREIAQYARASIETAGTTTAIGTCR
ncbi:TnsD family Tn7-like transposition protein [Ralstonia pseudosolanacearum]|uniref:TnsD family Tn7-like transposition protein n=1 Tax=Ralstonia pseudosolanacearum TaxID=1310165 RepID=UPI003AAEFC10